MSRAVLFDAGGTLIHMDRRFFLHTLKENGVDADLAAFLNADAVAKREVGRVVRSAEPGTDSSRWTVYARTLMGELHCEGEALERVRAAVMVRSQAAELWTHVEDGTIEALDALESSGYRLGVVSNADGRVASFLAKVGLAKYFDVIVDSGSFGIEKPDPRIFLHACERMGIAPSSSIYVGDVYEVDALGARSAGLTPIMIAANADPSWECAIVRSLAEIPELLLQEIKLI